MNLRYDTKTNTWVEAEPIPFYPSIIGRIKNWIKLLLKGNNNETR